MGKGLKISPVEGVFEDFLKTNKEGKYITPLTYSYGMHVMEDGTAILLNTTDGKPITIAWVSNDGDEIRVIEFTGIDRSPKFAPRFRIAPEQKTILFAYTLEGKIMSAEWPFE